MHTLWGVGRHTWSLLSLPLPQGHSSSKRRKATSALQVDVSKSFNYNYSDTQKILRISNHSSQHPSHSKIWMHSQSHTGSKQQNPNSTHLLSSPWAAVSREVTTRRMKVMGQKQRRCHQQLVTSKSKDQWGRWEELRRRDFRNLTRF
jgi:hypothetical protein